MQIRSRISTALNAMSITTRFRLGVGLMVFLIVTVALTGYLSLFYVRNAEEAIRISTDIQRMVLEMDREMERARHLHAQFFLQYPTVGLALAHELYAQPSVRQVSRVIAISRSLKELITQSAVSQALRRSRVDLNLYLSSAMRFADTSIQSVELVTKLAAPIRGLEAQLDYHLDALSAEIHSGPLTNLLNGIRFDVQDYRVFHRRSSMQSAFNKVFQLRKALAGDPSVAEDLRRLVENLLDRLVSTAEQILSVDNEIKSKFNDFALQAQAVAPISKTLIELTHAEVLHARARIVRADRSAIAIMAAITLAGLLLAVAIASVLNRSITRRVISLTASAGELRKGNLNVSAQEHGRDELSELARTFNLMAARIRELVNNLELKVEERTAQLAESESRFHDLFEHSSNGVAVYAPTEDGQDFIFADINRAVESIEHVRRREIIGQKVTAAFPGVAACGLLDVLRQVARTGQSRRHPASFYSDGRVQGWREYSVFKLPSGEIVTVYDDLTDRKQAEIEKKAMQSKLQQAQKMEAIGVLAGGVAHDFNNILGIILGNAELALDDIPEWNPAAANLKEIRTASLRARDVIRQLLSFSRKSDVHMKPVAIVPIIRESLSLIRATIPSNIEIRQDISEDCGTIVADPVQIHQVMINLCTNAAHAMEETGGVLRVDLDNISVENHDAVMYPEAKPGFYVQLTVSDTGCGMTPDIKRRVFDPYFTTKEVGKGSGMGLAVVHGIVKTHGGIISVYSEPGRGSTFKVLWQVIEGPLPATESPDMEMPRGNERILLVDDEAALLNSTGRMLERLGYAVQSTTDPAEALNRFKANPAAFDLVITDMAMPKITGVELSREILHIRPTVPIILCSGFSDAMDAEKSKALGIRRYVEKPVKIMELSALIREVLE